MNIHNFKKEPLWMPDENSGQRTKEFMRIIEEKYQLTFSSYWEFHKWTVKNIPEFWAEFWDFAGFIYSKPYDRVVDLQVPMEEFPEWFEGMRLNFAENILKFRDERTALILAGEDREVERVSFRQLYEETRIYAAALKKLGLKEGDRVACYISQRKESVVAMLAVTSIGAILTGALPTLGPMVATEIGVFVAQSGGPILAQMLYFDNKTRMLAFKGSFGFVYRRRHGYINRIKQVEPKILFTIDQFPHNNKVYHVLDNIKEIMIGIPSLEKVIIIPSKKESKLKDIRGIRNSCFLDEFLNLAYELDGSLPELIFNQVSFSHPAFINYTSGTSGLPKTIVHGFGGLLTGIQSFWLHWDFQQDDIFLAMSSVGWVSWNVAIHLLFIGTTLLLYEGMPYFISPTSFWDMVDEFKITRIFITPTVMDELESRNYIPTQNHHLSSLRSIICAGSVVKQNNYLFALNKIKKRLLNGCGSTEEMGACLTTDLTLPQYLGENSSPTFGTAIECIDDERNSVVGKIGELAITKPFPSFPVKIWNDTNDEQFRKSYFSKHPGKFTIGDSMMINPITNGIIMCGRSDETIKQKSLRFGSSEIYNIVNLFPEIKDSLCVGHYTKNKDERAVLFIKMKSGFAFNNELEERLRKRITNELTAEHVPEVILETPEIPFTATGKKMEILVKKIINKMPHDPESAQNNECLKFYYNIPQLEGFQV